MTFLQALQKADELGLDDELADDFCVAHHPNTNIGDVLAVRGLDAKPTDITERYTLSAEAGNVYDVDFTSMEVSWEQGPPMLIRTAHKPHSRRRLEDLRMLDDELRRLGDSGSMQ